MSDREREEIFGAGGVGGGGGEATAEGGNRGREQSDSAENSAGDLAGDGDQGSVYNPQYEPRPPKRVD